MLIHLSPQVREGDLEMSVDGDVLTVNGEAYDFSFIGEGDTLPQDAVECAFLVSDVTRSDGDIVLTLLLPVAADSDEEARFPKPIYTRNQEDRIPLPTGRKV